jgi:squalene synthase HpnC
MALTRQHYENFSVLSVLVPKPLRAPFAHVYWFCRSADDIADEHDGSLVARQRALIRLREFRSKFDACLASDRSASMNPPEVFSALASTIRNHHLSPELFHALLDAFEQDQSVTRYTSLPQLLDYCSRSAHPVGRIVLQLGGIDLSAPASAQLILLSDAMCTALQLVNHCQDIRRDLLERDRVYIPLPPTVSDDDLRAMAECNHSPGTLPADAAERLTAAIVPVIAHSRSLFDSARNLPLLLPRSIAAPVHLMLSGGLQIQAMVERSSFTLIRHRPRVSTWTQSRLLLGSLLWGLLIHRDQRP